MTLRAFRMLVLAGWAAGVAACTAWQRRGDARARWAMTLVLGERAAGQVRAQMASGVPAAEAALLVTRPGLDVRAAAGADAPADVLERMRRDEAPRPVRGGGVMLPLKDADDWEVVGVVSAVPDLPPAPALPGRPAMLLPITGLSALAWWLWRWGGRAGERGRRAALTGWAFLGLPMLHLVVFSFGPVLFTGWLALHQWNLLVPDRPFVGLDNFRTVAGDRLFWTTLRNTALYVLYVPATMILALGVALLLNRRRGGERLLRTVVFLPYVTSMVAVALVWQWMFNPDVGLVNRGLALVGLGPIDWLGSPRTALLAIILVTIWTQVGYQMVVFLAGLQAIPRSYDDAALVDGASAWQRLRHVTLPLLRPVTLFVLVTGVIGGFQVFTLVYLMTEGGPLHSTDVLVYRIYQTAWEFLRFGEASAMAVVLFLVLLVLTVVQFRLLGRRTDMV